MSETGKTKKQGIEQDLHYLQEKIKSRLNQLRNLYKENMCYQSFILHKKIEEEYLIWRQQYYQDRKWRLK